MYREKANLTVYRHHKAISTFDMTLLFLKCMDGSIHL